MRHLFLMDPLEGVRIDKDSTFALMCEAQDRGHLIHYGRVEDLYLASSEVRAVCRPASLQRVQGQHASLGPPVDLALHDHDIVWMRKDPPFHMGYVFNTYLLERAAGEVLVVNHPSGLRSMNEKLWALQFGDLVPPTLVGSDMARIRAFLAAQGAIVVKPLDGNGGEGVFVVRGDDPNLGVILEVSTAHGTKKVMAQRYLPEARQGDKRIILVDGRPVGAVLRVPQGVDHRGNIHAGAAVRRTTLTARDREICDAIGPPLREAGQLFVGIDVIGGWLTEVNVTSPTGIHEIEHFDGVSIRAQVVDAAIARLG
jgi:glutathione synthase